MRACVRLCRPGLPGNLGRVSLCGCANDIHTGLHRGSVPAVEFTLTTQTWDFDRSAEQQQQPAPTRARDRAAVHASVARAPAAGPTRAPIVTAAPPQPLAVLVAQRAVAARKERFTVRCLGTQAFADAVALAIEEGCLLELTGTFRTVLSTETVPAAEGSGTARPTCYSHIDTFVLVDQSQLQRSVHLLRILQFSPWLPEQPGGPSVPRIQAALRAAIFASGRADAEAAAEPEASAGS